MDIKAILALSIAITGAILGWIALIRPICKWCKDKSNKKRSAIDAEKADQKQVHNAILLKLDHIEISTLGLSDSIAQLQRDNIERAYCMFVVEHGYCPSGMKESISDMFESYKSKGYNHIAQSRIDEIMALPEFPKSCEK